MFGKARTIPKFLIPLLWLFSYMTAILANENYYYQQYPQRLIPRYEQLENSYRPNQARHQPIYDQQYNAYRTNELPQQQQQQPQYNPYQQLQTPSNLYQQQVPDNNYQLHQQQSPYNYPDTCKICCVPGQYPCQQCCDLKPFISEKALMSAAG